MNKGRDILTRAGIAEAPPPVPDFDAVFKRLGTEAKQELYADLREVGELTTADALRVWKQAITRSFGGGTRKARS
jgi:hypothetical protein